MLIHLLLYFLLQLVRHRLILASLSVHQVLARLLRRWLIVCCYYLINLVSITWTSLLINLLELVATVNFTLLGQEKWRVSTRIPAVLFRENTLLFTCLKALFTRSDAALTFPDGIVALTINFDADDGVLPSEYVLGVWRANQCGHSVVTARPNNRALDIRTLRANGLLRTTCNPLEVIAV